MAVQPTQARLVPAGVPAGAQPGATSAQPAPAAGPQPPTIPCITVIHNGYVYYVRYFATDPSGAKHFVPVDQSTLDPAVLQRIEQATKAVLDPILNKVGGDDAHKTAFLQAKKLIQQWTTRYHILHPRH